MYNPSTSILTKTFLVQTKVLTYKLHWTLLTNTKNDQVKLLGNADTDANPQYNIGLSERRVQDVAQYLVNNGVDANRLIGIANGDAKPVATNATANGKAENRRVDVYIHR